MLLGAFNAIYLRSEDKFVGHTATIAGVTGEVKEAGLFHIKIQEASGNIVYVSNLKLTENVSLIKGSSFQSPDSESLRFRGMYRKS